MAKYIRPVYLEVNLTQLKRNLDAIHTRVGPAKVMPMIKANAYGHGVDGVAPFIEPYVDYLGVAILEEGIHLREIGITKPILVAGGTLPEQVPYFAEYDLTLTGSSVELLDTVEEVSRTNRKLIKTHLKIDEGGRDVWYTEYNAIICDPDPEAVAAAVDRTLARGRDPATIRQAHIEQAIRYTQAFVSLLAEIFRRAGVSGVDASAYFADHFFHKMRRSLRPDFASR